MSSDCSSSRIRFRNLPRPFADLAIRYFAKVYPHFPILDEAAFWSIWRQDPRRISSTLMCDIYAVTLLYWNHSERLRSRQRPDTQFAWNQAVTALRDDYMAPSLTTVYSALLDMLGRPIYQVTANIVNAGRTVNLAHSLGLHRDPSNWNTSDAEKIARIKLWWGVLIHDHW